MTGVVELERLVRHSVERVFAAWLDGPAFAEWFLPGPGVQLGRVIVDPRVGGTFLIEMIVGGQLLPHTGVYRRIVPNRSLAFTWHSGMTGEAENLVEVWFEPRDGHTLVRLRHQGLSDDQNREAHASGWARIVEHLDLVLSSRQETP